MATRLTDYEIGEKLCETASSLVYRAADRHRRAPVVVKMLRDAFPAAERQARLVREYEILSRLALPTVIRAVDLVLDLHRPALVLEDFGGCAFSPAFVRRLNSADDCQDIPFLVHGEPMA